MKELNFPELKSIPKEFQINFPFKQSTYLINGEIKQWKGDFEKVYAPVYYTKDGEFTNYIGEYPLMKEADSLEALHAAVEAYDHGKGIWPAMTVSQRISAVQKFTLLMKEKREEIVNLLMWEIGKSLKDSRKEFDRTLEYINDTIEALKDLDRKSSRFRIADNILAQVRRAPLGVTLCMGPFNYPLNETFTTLIPALIMGNTVIFKPPKLGVLLHEPLLDAYKEAFPPGVVNTVYGDGKEVISPLMSSGKIDVLAFIGSSRVADILKKQHPEPHRLRSVLGLEAKNPAIILPDADLEHSVKECALGSLSYNGQRCTAIKIIYVHDSIYEDFLQRFAAEVESLKIGMPWDEGVNITPLPEPDKSKWLTEYIEEAEEKGARLINENGGKHNHSLFFPAILADVTNDMKIFHEEQFGPVVPVLPYSSIEEPMEYVVNSNYGQQAAIFGNDTEMISKLIDTFVNQLCRVNINSQCQRGPDVFPFTGRKDSAEGTLSVSDALRVFSIRTLVAAKGTDANKAIITDIVQEQRSNFLSTDFIF
jgi:glyceraldehyde-3-phosphate dehydrogenase (NADP+)